FGTVTDIDDQVRAEEEIKRLNTTLEERVRIRTEQVRSLTASLTLAEQHERRRIAQILHDDIQQMLYGLDMAVQQLRKRNDPAKQKRFLDQMDEILDQAIDTTRSLTVELSPPVLQGEGLAEALQWLAVRMEQVHNLEVTVHAEGSSQAPSEDQHIMLYQMVRELLFNIVKHTEVNQAHIDIRTVDHQLIITVSDEGQGFNPDEKMTGTVEGTGFGLASIQERLDIFGGHLTIDSVPGGGTRIIITTPMKAEDAA
ncbi:MAG TPA: sensor histidine kinase, partial [Rhodothermales bacterium]|nr:sensor histidine kinase [Rhodothermales bacterium]